MYHSGSIVFFQSLDVQEKRHCVVLPAPPLRFGNDRMRVAKMSGKGVLFVRQSPAREM